MQRENLNHGLHAAVELLVTSSLDWGPTNHGGDMHADLLLLLTSSHGVRTGAG